MGSITAIDGGSGAGRVGGSGSLFDALAEAQRVLALAEAELAKAEAELGAWRPKYDKDGRIINQAARQRLQGAVAAARGKVAAAKRRVESAEQAIKQQEQRDQEAARRAQYQQAAQLQGNYRPGQANSMMLPTAGEGASESPYFVQTLPGDVLEQPDFVSDELWQQLERLPSDRRIEIVRNLANLAAARSATNAAQAQPAVQDTPYAPQSLTLQVFASTPAEAALTRMVGTFLQTSNGQVSFADLYADPNVGVGEALLRYFGYSFLGQADATFTPEFIAIADTLAHDPEFAGLDSPFDLALMLGRAARAGTTTGDAAVDEANAHAAELVASRPELAGLTDDRIFSATFIAVSTETVNVAPGVTWSFADPMQTAMFLAQYEPPAYLRDLSPAIADLVMHQLFVSSPDLPQGYVYNPLFAGAHDARIDAILADGAGWAMDGMEQRTINAQFLEAVLNVSDEYLAVHGVTREQYYANVSAAWGTAHDTPGWLDLQERGAFAFAAAQFFVANPDYDPQILANTFQNNPVAYDVYLQQQELMGISLTNLPSYTSLPLSPALLAAVPPGVAPDSEAGVLAMLDAWETSVRARQSIDIRDVVRAQRGSDNILVAIVTEIAVLATDLGSYGQPVRDSGYAAYCQLALDTIEDLRAELANGTPAATVAQGLALQAQVFEGGTAAFALSISATGADYQAYIEGWKGLANLTAQVGLALVPFGIWTRAVGAAGGPGFARAAAAGFGTFVRAGAVTGGGSALLAYANSLDASGNADLGAVARGAMSGFLRGATVVGAMKLGDWLAGYLAGTRFAGAAPFLTAYARNVPQNYINELTAQALAGADDPNILYYEIGHALLSSLVPGGINQLGGAPSLSYQVLGRLVVNEVQHGREITVATFMRMVLISGAAPSFVPGGSIVPNPLPAP